MVKKKKKKLKLALCAWYVCLLKTKMLLHSCIFDTVFPVLGVQKDIWGRTEKH